MMAGVFFYIILGILLLDYLVERILDWLNSTYWSDRLPEELEGIYDQEKYSRSQRYERIKQKFSLILSTLTFLIMLVMLMAGGFGWVDAGIRHFTNHPIPAALLFFGILGLGSSLLSMPFLVYHVFVIEEKFGFNRTTVKTFILDHIKGLLLSIVLGGGLISLIIFIYESTGNWFWLIVWGVMTFFMIFISMFYSNLIVPLFNKQTPLDPGPLRDAIEMFATKVGFKLKNIYIIDGSKRSKKANAYFTGLGMKKRIVLYDTLIQDHTVEELVAILAHEIGHYKKKHTLMGILLSTLQTGIMLFILSLFIRKDSALANSLCQALSGLSGIAIKQSFHIGVLAFGLLYSPLSFFIGLVMNRISRKHEYAADRFAGLQYDPVALMNALKKLSVNNLSNLRPHPAYVFFYYSHPTLLQRLKALEKFVTRNV
ncbi:MAG: M48 family metallopeptidase [Bacteroidetes bacterium]|nr:M48 family metallopeptidase [Bacteroidota bacterium]